MQSAKLALAAVVVIDMMGQGLALPIFAALLTDPAAGFLQPAMARRAGAFDYSLLIGLFFLAWFLGVVFVSRLSDAIGRKRGLLVCLTGLLAGYGLTLLAMAIDSFPLLVIARCIAGFTAGTQPIAQAAMVELSADEAEKGRNMGLVVLGGSLGLMAGPIIGGSFSDPDLVGSIASLWLPFAIGGGLTVLAIVLVLAFFREGAGERIAFTFRPFDVVALLLELRHFPAALRISAVYFFFMVTLNVAFVFMATYLGGRFHMSATGTSVGLLVFGTVTAATSALLVGPVQARLSRLVIVVIGTVGMAAASLIFVATPSPLVSYAALGLLGLSFGLGYPMLLAMYSASVEATRQGWIMGVSAALFTLGAGLASLLSGELMALGLRTPFYLGAVSAGIALLLIVLLWQTPRLRALAGSA